MRSRRRERIGRRQAARWRHGSSGWPATPLFGLWQALKAQGKDNQAAAVEQRFQKAWVNADVKLTASRF